MPDNLLYYGDNLDILKRYVDDESVDLIYLDPPFNSNADYDLLWRYVRVPLPRRLNTSVRRRWVPGR